MRKTAVFFAICMACVIPAVSSANPKMPFDDTLLTDDEQRAIEKEKKILDQMMKLYAKEALERPKDIAVCVREMFSMWRSGQCRDRFSNYFPPKTAKHWSENAAGKFGGIGITVTEKNGRIVVVSTIAKTPAARAGLQAGDIITKINGKEPATLLESTDVLRGKVNTKVTLTIFRPKIKKEFNFTLIREIITSQTLKWRLSSTDKKVGIIELSAFDASVLENFSDAVIGLVRKGAKSIVFDLRNNLGGYLDSALSLLAFFARDTETLVTMRFRQTQKIITVRTMQRETLRDFMKAQAKIIVALRTRSDLKKIKVAIVVNRYSASASEIFAGAMKDWGYPVVGEKTFGKGVGQTVYNFTDSSIFALTTFEFLVGNNNVAIRDKGVLPTIEVKTPEKKADEKEDGKGEGNDPQLNKAIEVLKFCGKADPARTYKCVR